jgi:acyl carrier protein
MTQIEKRVRSIIQNVLEAKGDTTDASAAQLDANLYEAEGGLGLDSLATAELSVLLEQEFGTDPYSKGQFVTTLEELVNFYQEAA